jgi:hypothetical protein
MDHFFDGLLPSIIGALVMALLIRACIAPDLQNTAYTKGITDCRSGKVSYTVTVGPEGVDTTYTYKP